MSKIEKKERALIKKMQKTRDVWEDDDKFTEKLRGWNLNPPAWVSPLRYYGSIPRMTNAEKEDYRRKWKLEDEKRDKERKIQMDRLENDLEMIGSTEKINTSIYKEFGGGKKRTRRVRRNRRSSRKTYR